MSITRTAAAGLSVLALCLSACLWPGPALYLEGTQARLEQEFAGTPVKVLRRGDEIVVRFPEDVTFLFDSSEIGPGFASLLDGMAEVIRSQPETRVDVSGHADAIGAEEYNQRLSERRARAVTAALVGRGVAASYLATRGQGESNPVASNETDDGRARNRRVEVTIKPPPAGQ